MFENQLFKPTGDRILVKRDPIEERSAGGIYIPDSARERQEKAQGGVVLAVGAGKRDANGNRMPVEVKEGDRVYIGKYAGTEVGKDTDGSELIIIREDEVLGVVEK
jgi:chaperonin GroES